MGEPRLAREGREDWSNLKVESLSGDVLYYCSMFSFLNDSPDDSINKINHVSAVNESSMLFIIISVKCHMYASLPQIHHLSALN